MNPKHKLEMRRLIAEGKKALADQDREKYVYVIAKSMLLTGRTKTLVLDYSVWDRANLRLNQLLKAADYEQSPDLQRNEVG